MIDAAKPYRLHLISSADLITSPLGFSGWSASLRLERKRRAAPLADQASILRFAASHATAPSDLLHIGIKGALLVAAGVPPGESTHLRPEQKARALRSLIDKSLVPAGENFVEELVRRFLLMGEKAVNSSMHNAGEAIARSKISRAVIAGLNLSKIPYSWLYSPGNAWIPMPDDDSDIELHLHGLSWAKGEKRRTLVFKRTAPFLRNNVDLCLLACGPEDLADAVRSPAAYVALGELKGEIDLGGADEHGGKTAKAALDRIRWGFEPYRSRPHTFFLRAAIAKKMAREIWDELEAGTLENAANLTDKDQVASLSRWLCSL